MSNFILVAPAAAHSRAGDRLFRQGLELARILKRQAPHGIIELDWAYGATFTRANGSGTSPTVDPLTGDWLMAAGSWFHDHGFSIGQEARLLERYRQIGPQQLGRELQGFFVLLIGDAARREIVVMTDIVGSCHCFVRTFDQMIAISGSSSLLAALDEWHLDPVACQEFLGTGVIYEDRTLYREVRKVGPASIVTVNDGTVHERSRYWSVSTIQPGSLTGAAAVEGVWTALTQAARGVEKAFPHVVCDLTGGFDSRSVVASFVHSGVKCATTVSGRANHPDVVIARGLARLLGLPHLHIGERHEASLDELSRAFQVTNGEFDLVEYAGILRVHEQLMPRFDASINGSFGELARGYWWEVLFPHAGRPKPLDVSLIARRRYAPQVCDPPLFRSAVRIDVTSHLAGVIERTISDVTAFPNTTQMDQAYLEMRMQRWQGRIASSTDQLWPCLSPFMFRPLLETILRVHPNVRRRNLLIRWMLSTFAPEMAEYPLAHGYPAIPATWRNVYRFWPLPVSYAKKAMEKAGLGKFKPQAGESDSTETLPIRLQLWRQEKIDNLLQPEQMKSIDLFIPDAIERFLERSRARHFPFEQVWTRLLTLEWTIQTLAAAKVSCFQAIG